MSEIAVQTLAKALGDAQSQTTVDVKQGYSQTFTREVKTLDTQTSLQVAERHQQTDLETQETAA